MRRRHPTHSDAASSKDFFELKNLGADIICRRSTKASIPVFQTGDGVSESLACSIWHGTQVDIRA